VKDFFISYNKADKAWAEWIAWQLEEAGYTTIIQAWDFRPGENFVLEMQKAAEEAEHTLAVLSPDYLKALYTQPEWTAAFAPDPTGKTRTLLPVHVRVCELKGLLSQIIYIDLVSLTETAARDTLLQGISQKERMKPSTPPAFPLHSIAEQPAFPGYAPIKTDHRNQAMHKDKPVIPGGNRNISIKGDVIGSVLNQSNISGSVSVSIQQLANQDDPNVQAIKDLLTQLQTRLEQSQLPQQDKADALEEVKTLAEAARSPTDPKQQGLGRRTLRYFEGLLNGLSKANQAADDISGLVELMGKVGDAFDKLWS
jgi:hypothetical protein